jgi:hypothetical protein
MTRPQLIDLKRKALDLVREEYALIAAKSRADLERINRVRPSSRRYNSRDHLLNEAFAVAGAVSSFAVNLGVLSPDEARQIIHEFEEQHPDL